MHKNILGLFLIGLFLLAACNRPKKPTQGSKKYLPKIGEEMTKAKMAAAEAQSIDTLTMLSSKLSPEAAKAIIEGKSTEIVQLISRKSFATIGKQYTHPVHGIRFSPYSYIELKSDQVYASTQVMKAWGDTSAVNWGTQDGEGGDILLPFPQYYERYICNKDYKTSKKVKYNETEGTGNMIDNWLEVYPNAIMVEYYMDGTNPKFGGMDWGLLRLFFEVHHGKWWLVGIAHGEWTT
ncbi:MAG: hypothetical protein AB8B69_24735 [Chitinophagales bacterium]